MLKKNRVIANSFLYLFICIFFMGCKGINNDSTEEYVDSYSKTALNRQISLWMAFSQEIAKK